MQKEMAQTCYTLLISDENTRDKMKMDYKLTIQW